MSGMACAASKGIGVLVAGAVLASCAGGPASAGLSVTVKGSSGRAADSPGSTGSSAAGAAIGTTLAPTSLSAASSAGCELKEAFAGSLASYVPRPEPYGAKTPRDAAKSTQWGRPPQYGSAETAWTTVSSRPSSVKLGSENGTTLVVVQLPDRSWVVLSGERCK